MTYNKRGESIRGGFHTDQNETFMTSDSEQVNVFTQQI